ncbi:unnamed protein product [Durusdinium trenchii]|uniref:Uncharacterized protein n=2 Tax=Durusdinium trenchii TaxID=1381693 RepID=A0ABP0IZJ6_9DINO
MALRTAAVLLGLLLVFFQRFKRIVTRAWTPCCTSALVKACTVNSKQNTFWKGVMMLNAACWGGTFIAAKASIDSLKAAGVPNAGASVGFLRFALATLPLLPWLHRSSCRESAAMSLVVGAVWGMSYACTFISYTLGTTGAKAAFITSLQSLVVAACTSCLARKLQRGTLFSACLAVLGVAFLELNGSLESKIGDVICIAAPICVGVGWHLLGSNMKKYPDDFVPSVVIQFFVFTAMFGLWLFVDLHYREGLNGVLTWIRDLPTLLQTPNFLWPLLFSSIVGNLVTMMSANLACRFLDVVDVSLIVTTEPLWAAVAAACILGETFQLSDYIGCICVMAALLCNELWKELPQDDWCFAYRKCESGESGRNHQSAPIAGG